MYVNDFLGLRPGPALDDTVEALLATTLVNDQL